jgi:Uncharacterised nucleotidyltransferase
MLRVARSLRVDVFAAECVRAMREAGLRPILIKGPAVARLLYSDGTPRAYLDCDLLISARDRDDAERVLIELGFEKILGEEDFPEGDELHAHTWRRGDDQFVDLHTGLLGPAHPVESAWEALSAHVVPISVGGCEMETLAPVATALILALHAAGHGRYADQVLTDLERALATLGQADWEAAASLAAEMGVLPAMSEGLRLVPAGKALADRLGLPHEPSVVMALKASAAPAGSLTVARIAETRGLKAKAALGLRRLAPSRRYMRAHFALAGRGRLGLAAAYAARMAMSPVHLPRAVNAWRRARRSQRTPG